VEEEKKKKEIPRGIIITKETRNDRNIIELNISIR
jgi:hypothetical protein